MFLPAVLLACSGLLPTTGCGTEYVVRATTADAANSVQAQAMTLSPMTATLQNGATTHFSLSADSASSASECVWESAQPSVLASKGGGDFVGVSVGTATVSVTCGSMTLSSTAAVTNPTNPNAIAITSGGTYSGNWSSNTPSAPAVGIYTSQPVTVVDSTVTGPGFLFQMFGEGPEGTGGSITLKNVTGTAVDPGVSGQAKGMFFGGEVLNDVSITHCTMVNTSFGIYIVSSQLASLQISDNSAVNLDDRMSDGNGGYLLNQTTVGHFIILADDTLPNGGEIAWNQLVNQPGQSSINDIVNFYQTLGAPGHPILMHDNYLQGAVASGYTAGYTGGGVQMDGGSNDPARATGFIDVYDNVVVHSSGYGFSIGAGHDITMQSNRAVSCGGDPGANWQNGGAVAYYLGNYAQTNQFYNNHLIGNTGGFVEIENGVPVTVDFNILSASTSLNVTVDNNVMDDPCWVNGQVSQAAETAEWQAWQARLTSASRKPGNLD